MKRATWPTVKLGDIADFRNGLNYSKENFGSGLKVINVKDFQDHLIADLSDLDEINPDGLVRDECLIREGDILFVRSNGNRDLIGRSMLVKGVSEPISHSAFSIKARFTSKDVLPRFYAYLFRTSLIRTELSNRGGGTNISNLNQDILSSLEVPKPLLALQRKISSILSAYDDLIENNTRRIAILEEMAQSLYREWFVEVRFPGHEKARFIDSPLGRIPEGWKRSVLGDVASVNGQSLKKGEEPEEVHYVDIASVTTGRIEEVQTLSFADAPGRARRIVRHGDVIWSTVRPNRKSYSLILNPVENLIVSTGFAVITASTAPYTYIYCTVTTEDFVSFLVNNATGSAYPAVTGKEFEKAPILMPDQKTALHFHDIVEPWMLAKHCMMKKNDTLRTTRDLLLPKLLSGQVDVEDLDIDIGESLAEADAG